MITAVLLSGCANNLIVKSPSGTTTTLILLRHAERPTLGKELTDKGRARAAALPTALQGIHVDAIYSPNLSRNLDTVAPLARRRGLFVEVIEPSLGRRVRRPADPREPRQDGAVGGEFPKFERHI